MAAELTPSERVALHNMLDNTIAEYETAIMVGRLDVGQYASYRGLLNDLYGIRDKFGWTPRPDEYEEEDPS